MLMNNNEQSVVEIPKGSELYIFRTWVDEGSLLFYSGFLTDINLKLYRNKYVNRENIKRDFEEEKYFRILFVPVIINRQAEILKGDKVLIVYEDNEMDISIMDNNNHMEYLNSLGDQSNPVEFYAKLISDDESYIIKLL